MRSMQTDMPAEVWQHILWSEVHLLQILEIGSSNTLSSKAAMPNSINSVVMASVAA